MPSSSGRDAGFLHLHTVALRALPLPLLVVDVPFQLFHLNSALLAGHCISRIALQVRVHSKTVERKIFWTTFTILGLVADFVLPIWWALGATIPIGVVSWWVAYRSDWF